MEFKANSSMDKHADTKTTTLFDRVAKKRAQGIAQSPGGKILAIGLAATLLMGFTPGLGKAAYAASAAGGTTASQAADTQKQMRTRMLSALYSRFYNNDKTFTNQSDIYTGIASAYGLTGKQLFPGNSIEDIMDYVKKNYKTMSAESLAKCMVMLAALGQDCKTTTLEEGGKSLTTLLEDKLRLKEGSNDVNGTFNDWTWALIAFSLTDHKSDLTFSLIKEVVQYQSTADNASKGLFASNRGYYNTLSTAQALLALYPYVDTYKDNGLSEIVERGADALSKMYAGEGEFYTHCKYTAGQGGALDVAKYKDGTEYEQRRTNALAATALTMFGNNDAAVQETINKLVDIVKGNHDGEISRVASDRGISSQDRMLYSDILLALQTYAMAQANGGKFYAYNSQLAPKSSETTTTTPTTETTEPTTETTEPTTETTEPETGGGNGSGETTEPEIGGGNGGGETAKPEAGSDNGGKTGSSGDTGSTTSPSTPDSSNTDSKSESGSKSDADSSGSASSDATSGSDSSASTSSSTNSSAEAPSESSNATENSSSVEMHRLYNPHTGEHLFTSDANERDTLVGLGWKSEGVGWLAPKSGTAVWRLYNPYSGDHHYTTDKNEYSALQEQGWKGEGVGWYSSDDGAAPVWRLFNPNAQTGTHHFTTNKTEYDALQQLGWRDEKIGWYAQQ